MDTFLTLVIALGGIATGIGAIWAALAARRQGQISERQAQITERSLTLTERSLAEQNERSRLNLEVDLLTRMGDRWEMPHFLSRRRTAADYLLNNAIVGEDIVEVRRLPKAVFDVCNFFEELGDLQRFGALQATSVWNRFGTMAQAYWLTCEPSLTKRREERADPTMYEEFERLNRLGEELDRELGIEPHPQEWLRRIMEEEAVVGVEDHP
jgi:hypothetical protein